MLSSGPDSHNKSFHIKHDDKFFSRLVSKESSVANPSFRVYYGDVRGAVPFTWETRPGTPKYTFSDSTLQPPLSPPPSYYSRSPHKPTLNKQPRSSRLFRTLLLRVNLNKPHLTTSPSSSSTLSSTLSWSSSYSSSFSGVTTPSSFPGRRRFSSWGSSLDEGDHDDHLQMPNGSPKSTFCFPARRNWMSIIVCGSG